MNRTEAKITVSDILVLLLFLIVLAIPTYFAYTILFPRVEIFDTEEIEDEQTQEQKDTQQTVEDEVYIIECPEGEVFEDINGYTAYISFPDEPTTPPSIVIYGHGSTTYITSDLTDPDMVDISSFAKTFNEANYIFIALEQNYEEWDRERSVINTKRILDIVRASCETDGKVFLLGYSKGGSPTLNFMSGYPDEISKVALLAPTVKFDEWDEQRVQDVMNVIMKIWHGDMDENIPLYKTQNFVNYLKTNGKYVEFEILNGIDHWYLYDSYMDTVLEYFNS